MVAAGGSIVAGCCVGLAVGTGSYVRTVVAGTEVCGAVSAAGSDVTTMSLGIVAVTLVAALIEAAESLLVIRVGVDVELA